MQDLGLGPWQVIVALAGLLGAILGVRWLRGRGERATGRRGAEREAARARARDLLEQARAARQDREARRQEAARIMAAEREREAAAKPPAAAGVSAETERLVEDLRRETDT